MRELTMAEYELLDWGDRAPGELDEASRRQYAALKNNDAPAAGVPTDVDVDELLESWPALDLTPTLRGETRRVTPTVLTRDDGRALFYPSRVNGLHADSGIGKSYGAIVAAVQVLTDGGHVTWIDFEDDADTIVERLRQLGAPDDAIEQRFHYHRPTEFFSRAAVLLIVGEVVMHDVALVVIDSVGEAFGLEGVDENADAEVGPWMRRVTRPIAAVGAAVLLIDHATKAADNPLHPSGSKRKRAAITGASYLVEAPAPLTRDQGGRLRLTAAKDRHGHYRRGAVAAELEFTTYPDGGTTVKVWAPSPTERDTPDAKLGIVARAAVRAAKDAGRPLSLREITALMDVKASATLKRAGVDRAIADGALRTEDGPRRAVHHLYVRDLEPRP